MKDTLNTILSKRGSCYALSGAVEPSFDTTSLAVIYLLLPDVGYDGEGALVLRKDAVALSIVPPS